MVEPLKIQFLSPFSVSAAVFCCLVCSGIVRPKNRHPYQSAVPLGKAESVSGTVCSNPAKTASGKFYSAGLMLESAQGTVSGGPVVSSASGKIRVLIPSETVEALYPGKLFSSSQGAVLVESGERLCLSGSWKEDAGFFMADTAAQLEQLKSLSGRLCRFRALCRLSFKRLMFGWGSAGGFILALLSGSREYTEPSVSEHFRKAGLSHVLALSGMHLSFFASLAGFAGNRFLGKRADFWLRLAGIVFFVWFAGLSPSLFRALLCSLFMLVCGAVFCTRIDFFTVLCAVFLIHCAAFPEDMCSAAFILSYGALAGILVFSGMIQSLLERFLPQKIASPLAASAGAQIATAPVSASLFSAVTPIGIISSAAVSPLVSFFLLASVVAIAVSFVIPCTAQAFGVILNLLYAAIAKTVQFFALFPSVSFQ